MKGSPSNAERQLTKDNIDAIENLKRAGASVALIHKLTGFSESSIWKYSHNIEIDPEIAKIQFPEAAGTRPASTPPVIQPESQQAQDQRPLPKIESEINAPIPTIMMPTGTPQPDQPLIIPPGTLNLSDEDWNTIKLLIAGSALKAGYTDVFAYFKDQVVKDLDLAETMKNWLPGGHEELKRRFEDYMRMARTYMEMKTEVEEKVRKELNEKNGKLHRT